MKWISLVTHLLIDDGPSAVRYDRILNSGVRSSSLFDLLVYVIRGIIHPNIGCSFRLE